jgi:hypothetical protein
MPDLYQHIADLEAEIERLSEAAEQTRKIIIVAKVATAAGGLLLVAIMFGVFRFDPVTLVVGITAFLGGIAAYGTNRSTLDEVVTSLRLREARRVEMIDGLGLEAVEGEAQ